MFLKKRYVCTRTRAHYRHKVNENFRVTQITTLNFTHRPYLPYER